MADPTRRFDETEVDAILRRVIDRQQRRGELDRNDLVEAAQQLGIEPEEVDAAIAEHDEQAEVDREVAAWKARRAETFRRYLASFAFVNLGLMAINLATSPRYLWFIWPLLGWSLGVASQWWRLREGPAVEELESARRRDAKRAERARRKQERAERSARRRDRDEALKRAAGELGGALKQGVTQLLDGLGRTLSETAQRATESPAPRTRVRAAPPPGEAAPRPADEQDEIEVELERLRARRRK